MCVLFMLIGNIFDTGCLAYRFKGIGDIDNGYRLSCLHVCVDW